MNRNDFIEGLTTNIEISEEEKDIILEASINACSKQIKSMVMMEECAELSQAISKMMRYEIDNPDFINTAKEMPIPKIDLLEELADISICIETLIRIFNISDEMLNQAILVKLQREKERRLQ